MHGCRHEQPTLRSMSSGFRNRVKWVGTTSAASSLNGDALPPSNGLTVDTAAAEADHATSSGGTGLTAEQNPTTPPGVRGHSDFRSPGVKKTPTAAGGFANDFSDEPPKEEESFIPDFVTQTDRYGNATTPRSAEGIQAARRMHPTGPEPNLHVEGGVLVQDGHEAAAKGEGKDAEADAYESILDGFRMMCCCLLPEESNAHPGAVADSNNNDPMRNSAGPVGYSTRGHDAPLLFEEDSALRNANNPDKIKLLPDLHYDDHGKKCLVLDLDETLVHSSFRAVPGADFVIPVQIDDVVHFVYVMKRPGVNEFLAEMAKHYEIVVYTASLNKYADPLLDLLDPSRVIRTRLFRESCVFYGGNYIKDMSLLNRDLSKSIIIDNSPSSYMFHPENAIDCSSFIDDPADRELDHIGKFLIGMKDVPDVRGIVNLWRQWPNINLKT